MRDNMIFYSAYAEKFKSLTDEQFGRLVRVMIEYQETGEVPEIRDAIVSLSFDVVKVDIDRNNEKYDKICQRNKENGEKGGRPKESENNPNNPVGFFVTQENQTDAKKADKDKDKDKDITFRKSNKTIKAFSDNPELDRAIKDFIEHRKKLRKPMSDKAVELFISRLKKLSESEEGQIDLINLAILKGWQTVYPDNEKKVTPMIQHENLSKLQELERRALGE